MPRPLRPSTGRSDSRVRDLGLGSDAARLFVEWGDWDRAVADLDAACGTSGAQVTTWIDAARIRLERGDFAGYRRTCEDLIHRYGNTTDATTANNACWACCLGPDALPDLAKAVRLAELAVSAKADHNSLNTLVPSSIAPAGSRTRSGDYARP